jgi:hypothetical protein
VQRCYRDSLSIYENKIKRSKMKIAKGCQRNKKIRQADNLRKRKKNFVKMGIYMSTKLNENKYCK